ncbi:MAG TPA: HEAT repeat domain-containing protein [Dinghuibacter sp.]|uniref:HEAT repeat domain-containing protein n=1 Tax=Dinghuibacter sp. TaxID=2024697 RepID=UPI002C069EB8|nr:HEAT repeat domain-containing protein [Dinghuibacter sp.]HTJ11083.1 HEAT repeat domain-containing protein [Dinghuibacter sp.]
MFKDFTSYLQDNNVLTALYYYFLDLPLVIEVACVFILVALSATLLAYGSILVRRYRGYRQDKKETDLLPVIDQLLTEHVVLNEGLADNVPIDDIELPIEKFRTKTLRNPANRQLLIDRIVNYKKSFAGSIGDLLRRLYLELELDKVSFRKMKSVKWNRKVQGMIELTDMDMSISDVNILPLTNSKNRELRAEARNAYIKLSKNEPFKFFDVVTEPLLMWDQIELFKTITTTEEIAIPKFARWVTYSPNKSIVSFCLKLIVHYNQQDAAHAVIKLLDNKDHNLRADAINCLGKLRCEEAEPHLVEIYYSQPLNCQLEILKAIGRMDTGNQIQFLRHEFLHSSDFDIRKNAAKSLIKTRATPKSLVDELIETGTAENKLILRHCMNPLIKF